MKNLRASAHSGFTLIEVLVALAVVSFVLVALLGSMQAVVASATIIYDKTLATWVAVDKVTELRLAITYPEEGESSGETELADLVWAWSVAVKNTESPDIRQIVVKVAAAAEPEAILAIASGTVIRPGGGAAGGRPGSGATRVNGTRTTPVSGQPGFGVPNPGTGGADSGQLPDPDVTDGDTE